jgi:dipeptidyl aminopeptidase/acylaminoacyl peptidase
MNKHMVTRSLYLILASFVLGACRATAKPELQSPLSPIGTLVSATEPPTATTLPTSTATKAPPTPTKTPRPTPLPTLPPSALSPEAVAAMATWQQVDSDTEHRLYQISQTPLGVANVEWSPNGQGLWLNVVTGPMRMGLVPTNALVISRDTHKGWTTEQLGRYWPGIPNHSWSPDGRRLAYTQDGQLWIADADGQNPRSFPLPPEATGVSYPSYSPDGTTVALLASRTTGSEYHYDVWVLDIVSGTQKQAGKDVDRGRPIWSPGGNALAMLGESSSDNIARLWILDITSGQSVSADIGPLPGTEGYLEPPTWLLSGQKVLVTITPFSPGVWIVDRDANVERLDGQYTSERTTRSMGLSCSCFTRWQLRGLYGWGKPDVRD